MADYEKNTLLYTGDAQGNKVKCYPTTKAEYVEGLKEFIDSNESDESENNGSSSSGSNTFNRYATIVIGTATSGYTASDVDYLCTGSADQTIIKSAITSLPENGGKILLLEGTYVLSGNLVIDRDNVTLEGMGASTVIDRSGSSTRYCIYVYGASGCEIKSVKCVNATTGIYLYNSHDNSIRNCICSDNSSTGISLGHSNNSASNYNTFIDSCVCDNNANGISFSRIDAVNDANLCFTNNSCNNNSSCGIFVKGQNFVTTDTKGYNLTNIKIAGNKCNSNKIGIYICGDKNSSVANNICNNNSQYGIQKYTGEGGNIYNGNVCNDNASSGLYINYSGTSTADIVTSNQSNTGIYNQSSSYTPSVFENNYVG